MGLGREAEPGPGDVPGPVRSGERWLPGAHSSAPGSWPQQLGEPLL